MAFGKDLIEDINDFNESFKSGEKKVKLMEKLSEFVEFHCDAKRFRTFSYFNKIETIKNIS